MLMTPNATSRATDRFTALTSMLVRSASVSSDGHAQPLAGLNQLMMKWATKTSARLSRWSP
jgi:hypothetical protein